MRIKKKTCQSHVKKPKWLARKLPSGPEYDKMRQVIATNELATVCQEARCPNQFECYSKGSATFMILGEKCTRNCRFCNVQQGVDFSLDLTEPSRVAAAVEKMGLKYVVITSVTRDDLPDGGATVFAETIHAIRKRCANILIEVLIPDLLGSKESLQAVLAAKPDVLNHNVETVARLYPHVRPEAIYERSLQLLRNSRTLSPDMVIKTGVMVGLGETNGELVACCNDIYETGCDILILGQYLQPTKNHVEVERFVSPEEFKVLKSEALAIGFKGVMASPLVRSSYKAEELYHAVKE